MLCEASVLSPWDIEIVLSVGLRRLSQTMGHIPRDIIARDKDHGWFIFRRQLPWLVILIHGGIPVFYASSFY
jgi:hypothetical protein